MGCGKFGPCDEPKIPGGYCAAHRRQYAREWADAKRGGPSKQKPRRQHGCTHAPWFKTYEGMLRRATGKHGGRCYDNVGVCPEWETDPRIFGKWALANGYRPGLTIERKDPRLGYWPANCEWITGSENARRGQKTSPGVRGSDGRFITRSLHTGIKT